MTKPIKPKPKKSGYEARNKRMHDFGWKPSWKRLEKAMVG
jgi:hypothetical protein